MEKFTKSKIRKEKKCYFDELSYTLVDKLLKHLTLSINAGLPTQIETLKGVFAKNERGYSLMR